MPSTLFRAREWLADRYRWAQYPRQRFIPKQAPPPFFQHQMPLYLRFGLVCFGLVAISLAGIVLAFVGLIFWAIVTA
jgi:hypothetical protein